MGKRNKQAAGAAVIKQAPLPEIETISAPGKKVIMAGIGILLLGFIALSLTDPMGRNAASHLCPFLILGGYFLVGIGIFLPASSSPI